MPRSMTFRGRHILSLAFILITMWASPGLAEGPTGWGGGSCSEITAFPVNIIGPGVYCLSFKYIDFPFTQGALININSDDVVLDLNGATLDGTPTVTGAFSYGVRAVNHKNITVRNGTIKGFNYAIYLFNFLGEADPRPSRNYLVEDIRAIKNRTGGIFVVGNDSEVRRNYVAGTGNSNDPGVVPTTWAIYAGGWGSRIVDNDVHNTRPNRESGGEAYAIYLDEGVRNAIVVNNRISDASFGIFGQGPSPNWGKYRDNITANVGVPYTGGTDIGNNN
jgi:hypothetical protein